VGSCALALAAAAVTATIPVAGATPVTSNWLGYHGGGVGAGVAYGIAAVETAHRAWTSPVLDGQIYGEPLVVGHEVVVATENDSVYALSTRSGAVLWRHHVATPVPAAMLPCGDITPRVGITGTPVIDAARREIFVVALHYNAGHPVHVMFGLSAATGAVELRRNLPTPTSDQLTYLSRAGLALDHGSVIYAFGGNFGDCPTYHGVVGSLREDGSQGPHSYVVASGAGQSQGAVWMGGAAPAVDAKGRVWVASGNGAATSPLQAYDHSDAVLELTSSMRLVSFFAPNLWAQDNAADADLSVTPVLAPHGLVVAVGKAGRIYVLAASHLGGVGGQLVVKDSGCGNVLIGGAASVGSTIYLPCLSGPEAIRVAANPTGVRVLWHSSYGGGPPIVAASRVWTIGNDGVLYGLSIATGALVQRATLGPLANHFSTPSVGAGLLLAALATQVVAFPAR